ncbi:MAG: phage major capsid protein [Dehalococcoidia bacterium]
MAVTAPTKRSDFDAKFLPPEISAPIFEHAAKISVAQRLAQQVPLGLNGKAVPVVTGKMSAGWVAEGGKKPASSGSVGLKTIDPKKLAAIAVVSTEVVRSNPAGYMGMIKGQVAEAFALAFDAAAFHGTNTPFGTYLDQTTKAVELGSHTQAQGGVYQDLVDSLKLLVNDGKRLNGFALDNVVEPILLGQVDSTGRPIFIDTPLDETTAAQFENDTAQPASPGKLIGRKSFMQDGVATTDLTSVVGYAGDWTQAAWGVVGGISYSTSTEATVTIDGELVSLWENNLVAILMEAEYGWLVNDVAAFAKITNANPIASA